MKSVVLDTNVYISALAFGGTPLEILVWAELGLYKLFVSTEILYELQEKLSLKFGWSESKVQDAINKVLSIASLALPEIRIAACVDPDDDKILECATEAKADYIVSGDRHLLDMKYFQEIPIVKPAYFFENELWRF